MERLDKIIPNCKFYLCGGSVRDKLMNKEPKDKDYVVITNYSFDELVDLINKKGKVFLTKKEFLTIRCQLDGEIIDITYPRTESGYLDGRHPDNVKEAKTLEEDSKRRDFTINAMYLDEENNVLDFHNGQEDLKNGIIRAVGYAGERFQEDYLRILRAIRFAAKLEFEIEENTMIEMIENLKGLYKLSLERIKDELNKSLLINPSYTLYYIHEIDLDHEFFDILESKGLHFQLTNKVLK